LPKAAKGRPLRRTGALLGSAPTLIPEGVPH